MIQDDDRERGLLALGYAASLVGGQKKLATGISLYFERGGRPDRLSAAALNNWFARRTPARELYWPAIEELTESVVTRRHLRPDLFPGAPELPDDFHRESARRLLAAHAERRA